MSLPLKGVKIVELGTYVVVPTCTRILASWGAEVIKVESFSGDFWRFVGHQYSTPITDEENPLFDELNANKRLIAIDCKTDRGKEVMNKLISTADVFISNVRMKSLVKMGLHYESLKKINEDLIYAHFSGYGPEGCDANNPGFDLASYWARTGTMCDWVNQGDFPFRPPGGYGDTVCGSNVAAGILGALFGKERTGKGTFLSCSLYGAGLWHNSVGIISAAPHHGNIYPKSKMRPANPFSHIYKCRDNEWLIITVFDYNPTNYKKICEILGMEEYINDERYNSLENVQNHIEEFVTIMNEKFLKKDRAEWKKLFKEADLVSENVMHAKDVSGDPQAWENGYLRNHTYTGSGNTTAFPEFPVKFSEYNTTDRFDVTGAIGRDTREVLLRYGYSEEDYKALIENNAVK